MCTVTLIPFAHDTPSGPRRGLRLVTSRDERRDRAAALPPAWRRLAETAAHARAVFPTDPVGGGTWVAATDPGGPGGPGGSGLVLCLLNANLGGEATTAPPGTLLSRGLVIPALLNEGSVAGAVARLARLPLKMFAPFRLVAAEVGPGGEPFAIDALWDRRRLAVTAHEGGCSLWASSSLGDALVEGPRRGLFEAMVEPTPAALMAGAQDAFHAHAWPERRPLSVRMWRPDARTVSVTAVEMTLPAAGSGPARVAVRYAEVPDEAPGVPVAPRPAAAATAWR
jgi:hypothetical protein